MKTFKDFVLMEGNPLTRMSKFEKEGRHFVAISSERPDMTKKRSVDKQKQLTDYFRTLGYGVRKAQGDYEGFKEPSMIVHAKDVGDEAGQELFKHAELAGRIFDQDSILHHDGKSAKLHFTNDTAEQKRGDVIEVGSKLKYNNPKSPFQTELKPGKRLVTTAKKGRTPKTSARFTT